MSAVYYIKQRLMEWQYIDFLNTDGRIQRPPLPPWARFFAQSIKPKIRLVPIDGYIYCVMPSTAPEAQKYTILEPRFLRALFAIVGYDCLPPAQAITAVLCLCHRERRRYLPRFSTLNVCSQSRRYEYRSFSESGQGLPDPFICQNGMRLC